MFKLTKTAYIVLLLTLSLSVIYFVKYKDTQAQTQLLSFTYQSASSKGTQGHALGDMNGDGYLDIVLAEGEFSNNEIFAWLKEYCPPGAK